MIAPADRDLARRRARRGSRRRPSARARGGRSARSRPCPDRAEDPLADHGVLAHHLPLAVVERAGLVQDLVGDPDLADVVQQRGGADALDLARRRAPGPRRPAPSARRPTRSGRRCSGRAPGAPRRVRDDDVAVARVCRSSLADVAPKPLPGPAAAGARLFERLARRGEHPGVCRLERRDPDGSRDARGPARLRSSRRRASRSIALRPRGGRLGERIANSSPPIRQARSWARVSSAICRRRREHLVAGRVAVLEVELAEAVDVDQRDRRAGAGSAGRARYRARAGRGTRSGSAASASGSRESQCASRASSSAIRLRASASCNASIGGSFGSNTHARSIGRWEPPLEGWTCADEVSRVARPFREAPP